MASYKEIQAQIGQLKKAATTQRRVEAVQAKKAATTQRRAELVGVIAQIRAMMKEHGIVAADLGGRGKTERKAKGVILYANPAGGKGWTGKGRKPGWVVEALARGRSISEFLIK
ncbi:MAG: H-NS histone family protein [Betaproteobacteria bacterium]|nr:MAG: H-NS histone family protein [Betaproteobacteria bacterium]